MSNIRPNIFSYATKELSQDAVICWLIDWSWRDVEHQDEPLQNCGQKFVEALFKKHGKEVPKDLEKVEIWKQNEKIDVLARFDKYVLLIEDKTSSGDHSDQIMRYYEAVGQGRTKAKEVAEKNILPIYLQTGNQPLSDRQKIEKTPYKIFDRSDFLEVLRPYSTKHPILTDFTDHLEKWELSTQSFKEWQKGYKWKGHSWEGFYLELEKIVDRPGWWGWTNNRSGGFACFPWYGREIKQDGPSVYLQLECYPSVPDSSKLCFKVGPCDKELQQELKWKWHNRILQVGNDLVVKPQVMRVGVFMTVAVWKEPWLAYVLCFR